MALFIPANDGGNGRNIRLCLILGGGDACLGVVEGCHYLARYLPEEAAVPLIETRGDFERLEHELLSRRHQDKTEQITLAEVGTAIAVDERQR